MSISLDDVLNIENVKKQHSVFVNEKFGDFLRSLALSLFKNREFYNNEIDVDLDSLFSKDYLISAFFFFISVGYTDVKFIGNFTL